MADSSQLGEFWLASDAVIPSFDKERRIARIFEEIPVEEVEAFRRIGYTIGGMMIFPGNRIDRKMTINSQRGCHPRIIDRFDLTVECIRHMATQLPPAVHRGLESYALGEEVLLEYRRVGFDQSRCRGTLRCRATG